MTRTEAKRLARLARRHGYFDNHYSRSTAGPRLLWVYCPLCHRRVEAEHSLYAGTISAQLDAAVLYHLDGDCPGQGAVPSSQLT